MLSEEEVLAQANAPKPEAKKVDELEVLFESRETFNINGEDISIRPFAFGELPIVISLLKGVGSYFAMHQAAGTLNTVDGMFDVIAAGGENLIQALALNVKKPRSWFDTVAPDDGVRLMEAFLLMNIGFFTNRVLPAIKTLNS